MASALGIAVEILFAFSNVLARKKCCGKKIETDSPTRRVTPK